MIWAESQLWGWISFQIKLQFKACEINLLRPVVACVYIYIFMWRIWILHFELLPLFHPDSTISDEVFGALQIVFTVEKQGRCYWVEQDERKVAAPKIWKSPKRSSFVFENEWGAECKPLSPIMNHCKNTVVLLIIKMFNILLPAWSK